MGVVIYRKCTKIFSGFTLKFAGKNNCPPQSDRAGSVGLYWLVVFALMERRYDGSNELDNFLERTYYKSPTVIATAPHIIIAVRAQNEQH